MAKEDIRRAIVNSAVRAIFELENSRVDLTLRDLAAQEAYAKALKKISPVIAWSVSSNLLMGAR
jgi:hypothetical protein